MARRLLPFEVRKARQGGGADLIDPQSGNIAGMTRRANANQLLDLSDSVYVSAPIIPWDSTMAELRRAIAAAAAENRRFRVPRADITLPEPLEIDVSKVKCDFDGTVFSAGHGDDVITLVGRTNPSYWNSRNGIRDFAIVGAGEGVATSRALVLSDSQHIGVNGPNRIDIGNFVITQAGRGIVHWDRSYAELIHNYAVFDCGIGVHMPGLASDAGEGSTHFKGMVFQCAEWGVSIEGTHGTFMHFIEPHLDHNQRQIRVMGKAHVTMSQPHLEAVDHSIGPPILIGPEHGSTLAMMNATIVMTKDGTRTLNHYADIQTPVGYGGLFMSGTTRAHKLWTNSGEFATGTGQFYAEGFSEISDTSAYRRFIINNAAQQQLIDGGFEQSGAFDTLPDKIQISNDTAAITRRLTGANITLARNTSASGRAARTGNGFLTARHLGGAGSEGRFFAAVKATQWRKRLGWRLWLRKPPGLNTGSIIINPVYCALESQGRVRTTQYVGTSPGSFDTQDVDTIYQNLKTVASEPAQTINFSTLADGWNLIQSRGWGVVPILPYEWANHGALFFDIRGIDGTAGAAADYIDIDDLDLQFV